MPAAALDNRLVFVRHYAPTAITWGYREFVRPSLGAKAEGLYDSYRGQLASDRRH